MCWFGSYREYRKHDLVNKFRKLDNQVLEEKDCWLVEKDGYFWGDDSPETIPDFNPAEEDEWMDDSEFQQHGRKPFLSNTILNEQEEGGQNSPPSEQDWLIAGMEVDSGVTPTEWPTPVSSAWASPTTPGRKTFHKMNPIKISRKTFFIILICTQRDATMFLGVAVVLRHSRPCLVSAPTCHCLDFRSFLPLLKSGLQLKNVGMTKNQEGHYMHANYYSEK